MAGDTELIREIRDLLRLLAEPALAKRDERYRTALSQIIGRSKWKADAVLLMDGAHPPAAIQKSCAIDSGNFSRLIKALRQAELMEAGDRNPKLAFPIPPDFLTNVGRGSE